VVSVSPFTTTLMTTTTTTAPTMTTEARRKEKVYVLYGSQTGNSEQAAKDFCHQVSTKLSPENIHKLTGCKQEKISMIPQVEATHMQLDDFLELQRCKWTRLMIIFTSSYGVGQAPLGCYRFRDLCDAWHDDHYSCAAAAAAEDETTNNTQPKTILDGLHFAMCGLGDSKYTTYFQNPTRIDKALQLVGARRVGPLGQADASGTGDLLQSTVIERWMDGIWPHLAAVLVQDPPSTERLAEMEHVTVQLCERINPDFEKLEEKKTKTTSSSTKVLAEVLIVLVAIATYFYYYYHSQVGVSK
jgi:sulfite reductase alpha subunit-like flavoprotein